MKLLNLKENCGTKRVWLNGYEQALSHISPVDIRI